MSKQDIDSIPKQSEQSELALLHSLATVEARRTCLEMLRDSLGNRQRIVPMRTFINLTKTENSLSDTYLFRDLELESEVEEYLDSNIGFKNLIARYNKYDSSVNWVDWPKHYAVRVLAGLGPITSGKNIFSFFPEALRLLPRDINDIFGLEFIDIWENIFRTTIFPCVRKVFTMESQVEVFMNLESKLSRTIFLAAVFHELGHRCGPWKVSPHSHSQLRINSYHWGIMGEMATDTQLSLFLEEFPEITLFVILQRLFWFGRRGMLENPISGMANVDNDSWLGSYLWNKLIESKALVKNGEKWSLRSSKFSVTFRSIQREIDELADKLVGHQFSQTPEGQDGAIQNWMKTKVSWDSRFGYTIPQEFRDLLACCYEIPEQPYFSPPFSLCEFKKHFEENRLNFSRFEVVSSI